MMQNDAKMNGPASQLGASKPASQQRRSRKLWITVGVTVSSSSSSSSSSQSPLLLLLPPPLLPSYAHSLSSKLPSLSPYIFQHLPTLLCQRFGIIFQFNQKMLQCCIDTDSLCVWQQLVATMFPRRSLGRRSAPRPLQPLLLRRLLHFVC
jgi:hypothetical protein